MARLLLAAASAVLIAAAACSSGSPTSPSGTGATITGTVIASPSAANVAVAGTPLSSAVDGTGSFLLRGVPAGNVQLVFSGSGASSAVSLLNVADHELIELEVAIAGGTATVQREVRGSSGKVVLCHRSDTGYHTIDVSVNAEPAHRAHGDAKPGEQVPGDPTKVFGRDCRLISRVAIKKFTNGQDADVEPGPIIAVGAPVNWTYVVTNNTGLTLTSLSVTDDRGVAVACPQLLPPPGASITCNASGVAVVGQYRNVGTVRATAGGMLFIDTDPSHYHGGPLLEEEEPKVQLCHRTGNGSYHSISVGASAEPAHRAHGDGMVGEPVPGSPGQVFTASCGLQPAGPSSSAG